MLASLKNIFKVPDLRNKVLFTLFIVLLYRLGAFIPAPGIDVQAVQQIRDQTAEAGSPLGLMQLFSGGALTSFSLFALGIMPYITSSIIMQILGVVIPKLEQWQNQGAVGQRKITQWTRYVTIAIAILQATGLAFVFHEGGGGFGATVNPFGDVDLIPDFSVATVALIVLTLTTGTALLMWMGETVTQRGIGNGMSLLIFASVVASLPAQIGQIHTASGSFGVAITMLGLIAILVAIVFVEQGQRRIPVQFAKRVVGRRQYGGQSTYIPLKVNQAGVIPIIFASSVIMLPQLLTLILPSDKSWATTIQSWTDEYLINPTAITHMVFFGLLIVGFAYFYTAITFDPAKQADQLRKQGGFIPGYRPGPPTERYLAKVLSRITLPGALFIAAVALIPNLAVSIFLPGAQISFAGTSVLISVGVALETMKQIDSQLTMRNYEGFLK